MATRTIYNVQTGEIRKMDMVDARELINTGRWSFNPTDVPLDQEEPAQDNAEDLTSQAAYDQRKAEFEAAASEKASEAEAVEHEIKTKRTNRKK